MYNFEVTGYVLLARYRDKIIQPLIDMRQKIAGNLS